MAELDDSPSTEQESLDPGAGVEVRTGFDRSWAPGFIVADVLDVGYRLRRRSDDSLLPIVFPAEDVRRERKRPLWWF